VLRFVPRSAAARWSCPVTTICILVTQHEGFDAPRADTLSKMVLAAPDRRELVDWLRERPLMHALRAT